MVLFDGESNNGEESLIDLALIDFQECIISSCKLVVFRCIG